MTLLPQPKPPDAMSWRAQAYLLAAASRHLILGLFLADLPWLFAGAAFIPIFNLLPLVVWAFIMIAVGAVCAVSAVMRDGDLARWGMVGSAAVTLVLGVGLAIGIGAIWAHWLSVVGWHTLGSLMINPINALPEAMRVLAPVPPSPFLPVLLLTVSFKDFIVCAQPLRTPFESVRRLLAEG